MWSLALSAAAATHDPAVWSSVTVQADLDRDDDTGPRLWLDLHFRRMDSNFLFIGRPAVGWDVAKGVGLFAGYAWVPWYGDATGDELQNEHRAWQQVLLQRKVGKAQLGFRPRLEQRFVGGEPGTGHRVRVWGRAAYGLSDRVSLAVTDEVFLGLNDTSWTAGSNVAGFDQNRLFVGPALPIGGLGRVELGYLHVLLLRESGDTVLHTWSTNVYLGF